MKYDPSDVSLTIDSAGIGNEKRVIVVHRPTGHMKSVSGLSVFQASKRAYALLREEVESIPEPTEDQKLFDRVIETINKQRAEIQELQRLTVRTFPRLAGSLVVAEEGLRHTQRLATMERP